ncbi:MAG: hypothetical protein WCE54_08930 [Ignavibacteriaceae bacterium]
MSIPYLLFFISIIIWMLPPFRQFKTEYFLFFLILAIADPANALANIFLAIKPIYVTLSITFLLILSLIDRELLIRNWIIITLTFLVLLAAMIILPFKSMYAIKIILSSIVLFIILKNSLIYINKNQTINLFLLVLTLYEITIIIKFIFTASRTHTGSIYFYTTSFFEFFIGLFFSFFNKENSPTFRLIKEKF